MLPVLTRPRGSRNASRWTSPSVLSTRKDFNTSTKEEVFCCACPLVSWVPLMGALPPTGPDGVPLERTKSAHDLGGALTGGEVAYGVSLDVGVVGRTSSWEGA